MSHNWFYADASHQQQGPVDNAWLANAYQRGEISANTLVWHEGLPGWVPLSQVATELGLSTSATWFYVDRNNQKQGPIDNVWLAGAYQRGEISTNTLIWREGLANWIPLLQAASELGLQISATRPIPPSNRYIPVRKSNGKTGCLVAAVIVGVFGIAILGIIAAIALPAYQDYVVRAKVSEGVVQASLLKREVAEFFETEERCPTNGEGGIPTPESYASKIISAIYVQPLKDERCSIRVVFANIGKSELTGSELIMTMDADYEWTVSGNVPDRYLPSSLRNWR